MFFFVRVTLFFGWGSFFYSLLQPMAFRHAFWRIFSLIWLTHSVCETKRTTRYISPDRCWLGYTGYFKLNWIVNLSGAASPRRILRDILVLKNCTRVLWAPVHPWTAGVCVFVFLPDNWPFNKKKLLRRPKLRAKKAHTPVLNSSTEAHGTCANYQGLISRKRRGLLEFCAENMGN